MTNLREGPFHDKLMADTGIEVEMVFVPWDQYWEQKGIMLAAQEPIDLYWDVSDLRTMYNKKQCQPLDELVAAHCPDLLNVLPQSQLDGVLYGLPVSYAPSSAMYQMVCLRQDVLEKVGMDKVETPEDLRTFAQRAKDQFPDMKGPADIMFKPLTRAFADNLQ